MYDNKTSLKMEKLASDSLDSTQVKIDQINSISGNEHTKTGELLVGWQTWIGSISFSLAAVVGAILVSNNEPDISAIISLMVFITNGLWVTMYQKRIFERAAINASKEADTYRILYDNKKKAAFKMWQNPKDANTHLVLLEKEQKIMSYTKKLLKSQIKEFERNSVNYLNDIWLAMFITATYILLWPTGIKLFSRVSNRLDCFVIVFCLIWILFILIILRGAQSTIPSIKSSNRNKILKTKNELKHTQEYSNEIRIQINKIKNSLKTP